MISGWKTLVSVIGIVAGGLVQVCNGLLAEVIDANAVYQGLLIILGAFGIYGVAHKVEKNKP